MKFIDFAARLETRSCPRCGGIVEKDGLYGHKEPPNGDGSKDAFEGLDKGIAPYVRTLWENGIETYQSCEGGKGHSFPEPTIQFHGGYSTGFKAYSIAIYFGLPIDTVRLVWTHQDGLLDGPYWEMTFIPPKDSPYWADRDTTARYAAEKKAKQKTLRMK
jgi:hypothetical protein